MAVQASSRGASTPAHASNGLPEGEEMGQADLVEGAVELAAQDAMADVSPVLHSQTGFFPFKPNFLSFSLTSSGVLLAGASPSLHVTH